MVGTADSPDSHAAGTSPPSQLSPRALAMRQVHGALTARRTGPPLALRVPSDTAKGTGRMIAPRPFCRLHGLSTDFIRDCSNGVARLIFPPEAAKPQPPDKERHATWTHFPMYLSRGETVISLPRGSAICLMRRKKRRLRQRRSRVDAEVGDRLEYLIP